MGPETGTSILECAHCYKPFWFDEAKVLERTYAPESMDAPRAHEPRKLQSFARMEFWRNQQEEVLLRIESWREANEPTRGTAHSPDYSHFELKNLDALLAILGDTPDEVYLKAEILRNLGRFEESQDLVRKLRKESTTPFIDTAQKAITERLRAPQKVPM